METLNGRVSKRERMEEGGERERLTAAAAALRESEREKEEGRNPAEIKLLDPTIEARKAERT